MSRLPGVAPSPAASTDCSVATATGGRRAPEPRKLKQEAARQDASACGREREDQREDQHATPGERLLGSEIQRGESRVGEIHGETIRRPWHGRKRGGEPCFGVPRNTDDLV